MIYWQLGSNESANGVTTVASYIQDNNIPIPFVAMLFAHFMSMVIDRLAYIVLIVFGIFHCGFIV